MGKQSAGGLLDIREAYFVRDRAMAGGLSPRVETPTLDFRPYALICARAPSSLVLAWSYRRRDRCPPVQCRIHQPFIRPSCPLHFSSVRSMTGCLHPSGREITYPRQASCPVAGTQRVPGRKACRSRHRTDCMRASRSTSLSADIVHDANGDRAGEHRSIVSNPPRHPRLLSAAHADAGLRRRTSCPGSR